MRSCAIAVAVLLVGAALAIAAGQAVLNRRAEALAWSQVTDHYGTTRIVLRDRAYHGPPAAHYAYAQICYDVLVTVPARGEVVRKVALVAGDDDGGSFRFTGEFSTMTACRERFFRG